MTGGLVRTDTNIEIGHHVEGHWLGMTWNLDTIWTTIIAGLIVVILGFVLRIQLVKKTEDHIPTKLQILWETIVGTVNREVFANLGRLQSFVVPLAVALFFFILISNWLELIPSQINEHHHFLPAPTADTNLTYALALMVMIGVWSYGISERGARGFFGHFMEPFKVLLPLNVLEELTKPITLALRLFGNIFAGGIMLALIGLIPFYASWAPNLLWKSFDMFIGGIQAFIFALLTVLYFGMAGAEHAGHEAHDDQHDEQPAH